jgi:hypothetical protein
MLCAGLRPRTARTKKQLTTNHTNHTNHTNKNQEWSFNQYLPASLLISLAPVSGERVRVRGSVLSN